MKKKMMIAGLLFTAFGFQNVHANEYREKTQYLGVVNGQVVGNSELKVSRILADPILYRSDEGILPVQLRVRDAEVRPASGSMAYITIKQTFPDNQEARITLKTSLVVDGQISVLNANQQGEDVLITVPKAQKRVELRSDAPVDLDVPVNYRGKIQIALHVEGVK